MTIRYEMTEGPVVKSPDGIGGENCFITFKVMLGKQDVTAACVAIMNADQVEQTEDDDTGMLFEMENSYGKVLNDGEMPFRLGDLANYLASVLRLPLAYEGDEVDEAIDGKVV